MDSVSHYAMTAGYLLVGLTAEQKKKPHAIEENSSSLLVKTNKQTNKKSRALKFQTECETHAIQTFFALSYHTYVFLCSEM